MTDILDSVREFVDDFGWPAVIIFIIVGLLLMSLVVAFVQPTQPYEVRGTVLGLEYHPSSTSTGVGVGSDGSGNPVVVVTSNSTSEKWVVVMKKDSGNIESFDVNPQVFYSLSRGQQVKLNCIVGKWIPITSCL